MILKRGAECSEIASMWTDGDGAISAGAVMTFEDPKEWGFVMATFVRQLARLYSEAGTTNSDGDVVEPEDVETRIFEAFNAAMLGGSIGDDNE